MVPSLADLLWIVMVLKLAFNSADGLLPAYSPAGGVGCYDDWTFGQEKTQKKPKDLRTRCPSINRRDGDENSPVSYLTEVHPIVSKHHQDGSSSQTYTMTFTILSTIYTSYDFLPCISLHVVWTGGKQRLLSVLSCVFQHNLCNR